MTKVYFAGPDVFRDEAMDFFGILKENCAELGIEPLIPLDNEVAKGSKAEMAESIFRGNIDMIRNADVVIANVAPFRGVSLDVGTAYEIGFAKALGKKIYFYTSEKFNMNLAKRTKEMLGDQSQTEFPHVEDFSQFDNLMISRSSENPNVVFSSIEAAIAMVVKPVLGEKNGTV